MSLSENNFIGNEAFISGGAIKIDFFLPLGDTKSNNNFKDNISPYGPDLATYPIRMMTIMAGK